MGVHFLVPEPTVQGRAFLRPPGMVKAGFYTQPVGQTNPEIVRRASIHHEGGVPMAWSPLKGPTSQYQHSGNDIPT